MPTIELSVPGLLTDCTDGQRVVPLEADTLDDAIAAIGRAYPLLKPHVFDESGNLRTHVRLFYNGENLKWIRNRGAPLNPGDRLEILQAVSGG